MYCMNYFIAAQRDEQEALGGLEEQLGLLVMPDLTVGLKAFRDFVVNNGPEIQGGFKDLLGFAEQIGGAFTNVVIPAIQAIGGVWNSLPGPIKELLIGGFLANKAVKWTFGIDVAGLAGKALGGAISNLFKNATTAQMSVQAGVVNVGGAGVPGGNALNTAENTAGPAAVMTGLSGLIAGAITVAVPLVVAAFALNQANDINNQANGVADQTAQFVKTATRAQIITAQQATATAANELIGQSSWNPQAAQA